MFQEENCRQTQIEPGNFAIPRNLSKRPKCYFEVFLVQRTSSLPFHSLFLNPFLLTWNSPLPLPLPLPMPSAAELGYPPTGPP